MSDHCTHCLVISSTSESSSSHSCDNKHGHYNVCYNYPRISSAPCVNYPYENKPYEKYNPNISYFNSVITPVNSLTPHYSGINGTVQFRMRRKNKTVTLQWEPFSGSIALNGVPFLSVAQVISNLPSYPVYQLIYVQYKGINQMGLVHIDPYSTVSNIKFYLNTSGNSAEISVNDSFHVYGGTVVWIVD